MYDDVSFNVIGKRWGQWFDEIPELSDDELDKDRELLAMDDQVDNSLSGSYLTGFKVIFST